VTSSPAAFVITVYVEVASGLEETDEVLPVVVRDRTNCNVTTSRRCALSDHRHRHPFTRQTARDRRQARLPRIRLWGGFDCNRLALRRGNLRHRILTKTTQPCNLSNAALKDWLRRQAHHDGNRTKEHRPQHLERETTVWRVNHERQHALNERRRQAWSLPLDPLSHLGHSGRIGSWRARENEQKNAEPAEFVSLSL